MKWKFILPEGKSFIFLQLAEAAWKDLEVFGQLNNVNLKPINILLQFGLRKIFSTLNKHREQHLFSVEETPYVFIREITITPPHGFQEEMWDKKTVIVLPCLNVWLYVKLRVLKCQRQHCCYIIVAEVIIISFNWICLGLNGLILMD